MAAGRRIEDESDARRCLMAARRAGMRAGEWARAHGIDGRSLHAWQVNLGHGGTAAPRASRTTALRRAPVAASRSAPAPPTLVELVPTRSTGKVGGGRFVLEIAGARVEFGDDVSMATLRRVLEVLRAC